MIKDGYYRCFEAKEHLKHLEKGKVVGDASIALLFGNRSAGKTVSVGMDIILWNMIHKNENSMLLARTLDEKRSGYLESFFQNKIFTVDDKEGMIKDFLNSHDIKFDFDAMYVDGQPRVYCEAITSSTKVKNSGQYNHCTTIFMDEAVQPNERMLVWRGRTYLERIFEIWQTVARGYKNAVDITNLVFAANISDRDNWLFNDLGINKFLQDDTKRTCQQGIYVEIINNKTAAEKVLKSTMGMVMANSESGSRYTQSAQMNEYSDNRSFIRKWGLDFSKLEIQIAVRNSIIGIFKTDWGHHVAKIQMDDRSEVVTNEIQNHTERIHYQFRGSAEIFFSEAYKKDLVTFQDQETKGLFLEFLHLIPTI